ncbi:MAG TPA: 4-(cytidine 5'-diphospho)-2-C-methyl-D-erythritol kinase, partial [Chloroflexota bacterium]
MIARAYAKINLGLEVLGRRSDGFHEVATVLQTIDLADRLVIRPNKSITLECPAMEVTADNLILQAAFLLKERASVSEGANIRCEKRIPIGSGLGGGSADAAATLRTLVEFWAVRVDRSTLMDLAASLGADVPFLIEGGTALATGSGLTLALLPPAPFHWVVLAPIAEPSGHKTAELYAALPTSGFSDGSATAKQAQAI